MEITTVQPFVLQVITFTKGLIMPMMVIGFFTMVALRAMIYYTVQREETFSKEFEKRVKDTMEQAPVGQNRSFYIVAKVLLEKTFYEMFERQAIMKKTKVDYVTEPSDRLFLIQQGSARLVRDTLKEVRYLKYDQNQPQFHEIVKGVMGSNPCFTRLFGVAPVGPLNDMLSQIPGLFIVAGIFGTFLGIMQALPELGSMDIRDPESTKLVMDTFLAKIAFSMASSTIGIMLSVLATVFNNFVAPEKLFTGIVDRFERSLFRLWLRCDNNQLPENLVSFDENRDPLEALAEIAVDKELNPTLKAKTPENTVSPPERKAS